MGNAIRMGENIRGRRRLLAGVEEEEATSSSSSSDHHLRPLLSSHSHQPTSYPHAVLYYTSILLHHPDPIIPTTPPPLLFFAAASLPLLPPAANTSAHLCPRASPPQPPHRSRQTDRQCAHRIPDLSAAAQASFPLPHSILHPPSALRCHPIVRQACLSAGCFKEWIDPRPPSLYPAVVSTPAPSSSKQPPPIARLQLLSRLLLPTASVALAAAPGVRALHYSPRQTEPDTSCAAAPLPPNRRLYSSR